ncbi:DUF4062 domain-containing protein [Pseudomonas putida]|uniref:DUF4062 domain-containing protein n=1 Tax=Pseudomonas putida TaxID=303 RepID=UPI00235D381D|nr:DUF4062 domain-containing protein [Pseudomonas putida]GLO48335.1 hypothetical protein PPUN109347_49000 [Pseudomonas putida]HDS0982140.1 DUF4062 domain-containing protein [Pseudomonas putida]
MSIERRHQVFVSSTYEDLREERHEVIQALLELDCIPAGMELFPATDDDQWSLIKRVIDECDYYIIIVGGRYGSIGPQGISYTEQEYRYALETGKPIIAFLHKTPANITAAKTESNAESKVLLEQFRSLAQKKMCKYWETSAELGSVVSRSLVRLIKTHPMPGWVRADKAAESLAAEEVLRLRKVIDDLKEKLNKSLIELPEGVSDLAQGDEVFPVAFEFNCYKNYEPWTFTRTIKISWNEIFEDVGSLMLDGISDNKFKEILNKIVEANYIDSGEADNDEHLEGFINLSNFTVDWRDEQTIKLQLKALALIEYHSELSKWKLTPHGSSVLVKLRAIPKGYFDNDDEADTISEASACNQIE